VSEIKKEKGRKEKERKEKKRYNNDV